MQEMVEAQRSLFGERNHRARLTDDEVLAIRQSALGAQEIAKIFNISWRTVYNIRNRETWRHL